MLKPDLFKTNDFHLLNVIIRLMAHYQESIVMDKGELSLVYLLENEVSVLLRCETMFLFAPLLFTVVNPQEETTGPPQ